MRSAFRAITFALVGTTALLAVLQFGPERDRLTIEALGPAFPDDETTGSIDRTDRPGWIRLNDEQRGWIFLGVMNLPDVPDAALPPPEAEAALPSSIELQELPAMVTRLIPMVREHKFVKLDDRILLVRASDRVVVA